MLTTLPFACCGYFQLPFLLTVHHAFMAVSLRLIVGRRDRCETNAEAVMSSTNVRAHPNFHPRLPTAHTYARTAEPAATFASNPSSAFSGAISYRDPERSVNVKRPI